MMVGWEWEGRLEAKGVGTWVGPHHQVEGVTNTAATVSREAPGRWWLSCGRERLHWLEQLYSVTLCDVYFSCYM